MRNWPGTNAYARRSAKVTPCRLALVPSRHWSRRWRCPCRGCKPWADALAKCRQCSMCDMAWMSTGFVVLDHAARFPATYGPNILQWRLASQPRPLLYRVIDLHQEGRCIVLRSEVHQPVGLGDRPSTVTDLRDRTIEVNPSSSGRQNQVTLPNHAKNASGQRACGASESSTRALMKICPHGTNFRENV